LLADELRIFAINDQSTVQNTNRQISVRVSFVVYDGALRVHPGKFRHLRRPQVARCSRAIGDAVAVLEHRRVLTHEHVVAQRGDAAVAGELAPAVPVLGGVGVHLDEHERVRQRVDIVRVVLDAAARDRRIGVRGEPGGPHAHPRVDW